MQSHPPIPLPEVIASHPRTSHGTFQDTQGLPAVPPRNTYTHTLHCFKLIQLTVYLLSRGRRIEVTLLCYIFLIPLLPLYLTTELFNLNSNFKKVIKHLNAHCDSILTKIMLREAISAVDQRNRHGLSSTT